MATQLHIKRPFQVKIFTNQEKNCRFAPVALSLVFIVFVVQNRSGKGTPNDLE